MKQRYQKPETDIVVVATQTLLSGSTGLPSSVQDPNIDNGGNSRAVQSLWDDDETAYDE
jgi:hypothetical protein